MQPTDESRTHDMQGPNAANVPAGPPPNVPAGVSTQDDVTDALRIPGFAPEYAKTVLSGKYDHLAIWYIDIRNFRSINPNFGFFQGNLILKTLVENMCKIIAHGLPVVRLGADRFVLLSAGYPYDQAKLLFDDLVEKTIADITAAGIPHQLNLAGGIYYLRPRDLKNPQFQRPLDYVSIAHRKAHEVPGSQLVLFTDHDLEVDERRITIEQSIDEALLDGQVQVWYQPQIDYTYGEVIGAEALARWNHPQLGWISPAEFIPVLENCGKIHALDLFVWEEACRSASQWRNMADGKPVPISVNVSRTEMFEHGLMEHFLALQKKYDLPKGSLHLEVTESAFVEEAERLYRVINQMRAHDMLVEMDDFGSGLSSLNMLKDVPVDVVKLDMGFMQSAMGEDRGGVVLGSVIRMLQGLDTPIIAEGVETLEQAEMLKNMGCHLMQGFHFSRPMPLDDFEEFIASNSTDDKNERRERPTSHLEKLTSIDPSSSYLFNHAVGGTLYFFANDGTSESILVNDEFYRECGLNRKFIGSEKINPIAELDPSSRETMWRAAAEAHEYGSALCTAVVRRSRRVVDFVMRYHGPSARGNIYSLNVIRSHKTGSTRDRTVQMTQDLNWNLDLMNKIVPNGFIKCAISGDLSITYLSPLLVPETGLSQSEFTRQFHNSLSAWVAPEFRQDLAEAINESKFTGNSFDCELNFLYGYENKVRPAHLVGKVRSKENNEQVLYAMILFTGEATSIDSEEQGSGSNVIHFDYDIKAETLVLYAPMPDGTQQTFTFEKWLDTLEEMPEYLTRASASKILSSVSDLRTHPTPGFTDIKSNLRGGDELRWYHVNYTCDVDENGHTTVIHGYAHDANAQIGSARWWRRQAEIDQLTGLLNRNAVEQEMNLSMRTQGAGIMFMIDLDGFKRINDELGHLAGDALLRDVGAALSSNFRDSDVLGRYGGDEFVAFVPISGDFAVNIAQRRSQSVIEAVTSIEASDGTKASCSVGVAISHNHTATFYDLLEVADEAMYKSKERGKGCFTILNA